MPWGSRTTGEEGAAQAERRADRDAGQQTGQPEAVDHEVGARSAVAEQGADHLRPGDRVLAGAERGGGALGVAFEFSHLHGIRPHQETLDALTALLGVPTRDPPPYPGPSTSRPPRAATRT